MSARVDSHTRAPSVTSAWALRMCRQLSGFASSTREGRWEMGSVVLSLLQGSKSFLVLSFCIQVYLDILFCRNSVFFPTAGTMQELIIYSDICVLPWTFWSFLETKNVPGCSVWKWFLFFIRDWASHLICFYLCGIFNVKNDLVHA